MAALRSGVPDDDWDVELHRAGGHFLQSRAWQRVQQRLGYEVIAERGGAWLWAGSIRAGRFPRYVYIPYGPAGTDMDTALSAIKEVTRRSALDFARIEPLHAPSPESLTRTGASRAKPVQPRWTWILNLMQDESELRSGLSAGHRGSINAAPRRGLRIRRSDGPRDADVFISLLGRSGRHAAYRPQSDAYYRTLLEVLQPQQSASLYVAEAEGTAVAAAICFDFADTRYYAYAASDPDAGRRLSAAAPLVWQMILDARKVGKLHFDFWGVAPPGASGHRWSGFTQFKKAFGGELVERPGAWEIPVRPVRHRVFSILQTLQR